MPCHLHSNAIACGRRSFQGSAALGDPCAVSSRAPFLREDGDGQFRVAAGDQHESDGCYPWTPAWLALIGCAVGRGNNVLGAELVNYH